MSDTLHEENDSLASRLVSSFLAFGRTPWHNAPASGLSLVSTDILEHIYRANRHGKSPRVSDLGVMLRVSSSTITQHINNLEKQGFVEAYYGESTETNGGRRKYYKLTEYGRDVTLKNLNEWKYSRSLIDKLITEEKVDLQTTPPPESLNTGLNKKIPKTSTKEKNGKAQDEKLFEGNFFEKPNEKFVFEVSDKKTQSKISKKIDPIIETNNIQQSMFAKSDEQEKIDKKYKVLMDKLISTTQSHTATNESIVEVEKVSEKEEEKSYSLLHKEMTNPFSEAAAKIKAEGFKIRTYSPAKYKNFRQFVLINKLYLFTAVITYLAMIVELLVLALVFEPYVHLESKTYIIIASALLSLPLAGLINYLINMQKKVKLKIDIKVLILSGLLFFGVGLILIIAFRLMLNRPFNNLYAMVTEFVFPAMLLLNILTCLFFYSLLAKTKKFNV